MSGGSEGGELGVESFCSPVDAGCFFVLAPRSTYSQSQSLAAFHVTARLNLKPAKLSLKLRPTSRSAGVEQPALALHVT